MLRCNVRYDVEPCLSLFVTDKSNIKMQLKEVGMRRFECFEALGLNDFATASKFRSAQLLEGVGARPRGVLANRTSETWRHVSSCVG